VADVDAVQEDGHGVGVGVARSDEEKQSSTTTTPPPLASSAPSRKYQEWA